MINDPGGRNGALVIPDSNQPFKKHAKTTHIFIGIYDKTTYRFVVLS
jgi:hypothetical protein